MGRGHNPVDLRGPKTRYFADFLTGGGVEKGGGGHGA
jgi:hypothetical protein